MKTSTERNTAALLHLSALTQYFIPFGNFIFPILIWSTKKEDSDYIAYNGKHLLNFQLSVLLYSLLLLVVAVPIFMTILFKNTPFQAVISCDSLIVDEINFDGNWGWLGVGIFTIFLLVGLKIAEVFLLILAAIQTTNGAEVKYPLSIPFIK